MQMKMRVARILAAGAATAALAVPVLSSSAMAATTAPATANPVLHPGDRGAAVKKLQLRLRALHYDPGTIDGIWGAGQSNTTEAVWAFEEVNHFTVSNSPTFGAKMWAALAKGVAPPRRLYKSAKTGVSVDLGHQFLSIWKAGKLELISHISSGGHYYYYEGGVREYANTPTGHYHIYRKAKGWEHDSLGSLFKANYFTGGYAIHGEPDTPDHAVSHGCVRVPMHTSYIVANETPIGMLVTLYK
jgi:lipoprotein-anchoring transpeptidase ErfK/SrfK